MTREEKVAALRAYVDRRMNSVEFAQLIGCSPSHGARILAGGAWQDIPRPEGFVYPWSKPPLRSFARKTVKASEGPVDAEEQARREKALKDYVRERMTKKQFAEHIESSVNFAYRVLSGTAWTSTPRPMGFAYPWSARRSKRRSCSADRIQEAFKRYEPEKWSIRTFSRFLGVSDRAGWNIFHGVTYREIPRTVPPASEPPRPRRKLTLEEWKAEALEDYVKERMSPKDFAEHIGGSYSLAVAILTGQRWREIPRPEGFTYPWPERAHLSQSIRGAYTREEVERAIALRKEKGWSYQTLAEYMGVERSTTYRWEKGHPNRTKKQQETEHGL